MKVKDLREEVFLPEVLFEIRRLGKNLRVIAIDPETKTEVVMIAPINATKNQIKKNAARKLAYVIAKERKGKS
ncbi:MAG: hypothetical protein VX923_04075 [Pseudomonadota bacterium]|nr:hypothetical protein [Pseudomonadota bacterium]